MTSPVLLAVRLLLPHQTSVPVVGVTLEAVVPQAHSIDQLLTLLLKRVEERTGLPQGTLAKIAVEAQVNTELLEEQGE
jgi:hypothetical protein